NRETDSIYHGVCDYFTVTGSIGTVTISGSTEIKMGGSHRSYNATFVDDGGTQLNLSPIWSIVYPEGFEDHITYTINPDTNVIQIKVSEADGLIGKQIRLNVTEDTEGNPMYSAYLLITIVPLY